MTAEARLVARDLGRDFRLRDGGVRTALDGMDLTVRAGELVSVLGPNGAGKTTMVRIIAGLLQPTRGTVTLDGHDVVRERRRASLACGFSLGGDSGLYPRLTGMQNLTFFGLMYGMRGKRLASRTADVLATMGLADRAHDRVGSYSRGMKQRLHIARALLHEPGVLVLDEPSASLDPHSAAGMRELVAGLQGEGRGILLTTHDMREAEQLSTRIVLLNRSRVYSESTPSLLRATAARRLGHTVCVEFADGQVPVTVSDCPGLLAEERDAGVVRLRVTDGPASVRWVLATYPQLTTSVAVTPPSLEEVFIDMVGTP